MSQSTKIEWTDATINPVIGCTPASVGCANCYAARMAKRLATMPLVKYRYQGLVTDGRFNGTVRFVPSELKKPLGWKKPRRIFVSSMGDIFHENSHYEWWRSIVGMAVDCPQHTFQILTKRPRRMMEWVNDCVPPPNVWCGVSISKQDDSDNRSIPFLLKTQAAVRFVSCEPLLGPIELRLCDEFEDADGCCSDARHNIDWVIAGAETGPGARPIQREWVTSIRDQCVASNTPFFFKKWGNSKETTIDGDEWRQYPEIKT